MKFCIDICQNPKNDFFPFAALFSRQYAPWNNLELPGLNKIFQLWKTRMTRAHSRATYKRFVQGSRWNALLESYFFLTTATSPWCGKQHHRTFDSRLAYASINVVLTKEWQLRIRIKVGASAKFDSLLPPRLTWGWRARVCWAKASGDGRRERRWWIPWRQRPGCPPSCAATRLLPRPAGAAVISWPSRTISKLVGTLYKASWLKASKTVIPG